MRKAMAILGVLALGAAVSARAEGKKGDRSSNLARAMAVAEIDFDLHRAQLGLVGSTLPSEIRASAVERAMAVAEIDFDLHRGQLGLSGSSLLSEHRSRTEGLKTVVAGPELERPRLSFTVSAIPAAISDPRE